MNANQYISSIRNPGKRAYASRYWDWLTTDGGKEPDYQHADISYMAAQAVRLQLNDISERECDTGFRED